MHIVVVLNKIPGLEFYASLMSGCLQPVETCIEGHHFRATAKQVKTSVPRGLASYLAWLSLPLGPCSPQLLSWDG